MLNCNLRIEAIIARLVDVHMSGFDNSTP
jgi:hypothetical protein